MDKKIKNIEMMKQEFKITITGNAKTLNKENMDSLQKYLTHTLIASYADSYADTIKFKVEKI